MATFTVPASNPLFAGTELAEDVSIYDVVEYLAANLLFLVHEEAFCFVDDVGDEPALLVGFPTNSQVKTAFAAIGAPNATWDEIDFAPEDTDGFALRLSTTPEEAKALLRKVYRRVSHEIPHWED